MPSALDPRAQAQQHRIAGEAAFEATLWPDAVREYESALSLLSEHGDATGLDEAELLTRLGSCYWSMSEARTGWRTLRRAMSLYRDRGDALGFARATVEVLRIWGPWERQLAMADEALAMLGSDGNPSETNETAYLRARLLLANAWRGPTERFDRAIEIAEKHGFRDILARRIENQSWQGYRESGDLEAQIALALRAHDEYAAAKAYEPACGALRGCGFSAFEHGALDRGVELARRCVDYARSVHLRFHEELALTDLAGEAFARADYDRCHAILGELTTNTDFRADLYRMWIVERSGDTRSAVQMMVDPERAGRAATGMSQTHGAAAGVMYRAGLHEPARRELEQWAEIAGESRELAFEAPVLFECIAGLADDELIQAVCDAYEVHRPDEPPPPTYATLSGRAGAPSHGAMLMRLGRVGEAERVYREGFDWCERERVPVDAGLCLAGLAEVATAQGDAAAAEAFRSRARALFEQYDAKLYLDRVTAP